jgi:hypothetical protein
MKMLLAIALLSCLAHAAHATVYAYVDENGDYVVTQKKPGKKVAEYAVLTAEGEFVRLVQARPPNVPITHWRPWFMPKEPDPNAADPYREREGVVDVEEVAPQ